MYLETARMVLCDFEARDLNDLHEIFGDDDVMAHTEPPYDLEKTRRFLAEFCIGRKAAFAAALKDTDKVAGYVLFRPDGSGVYEMGWIFNKSFWRRGLAYEICGALISHAFTHMSAHKIYAEAIDTAKSVPLMIKLGMKPEGVQRKHTKDRSGEWRDLHWYAVLDEDFFACRA